MPAAKFSVRREDPCGGKYWRSELSVVPRGFVELAVDRVREGRVDCVTRVDRVVRFSSRWNTGGTGGPGGPMPGGPEIRIFLNLILKLKFIFFFL